MVDDDLPITDPNFYSSETLCPDSLIEYVFRPADLSSETIPLLQQRIAIMREVGFVLCNVSPRIYSDHKLTMYIVLSQSFGGSFQGFIDEFHRRYNGEGTALELVQMITDSFPSFRDEVYYEGQKGEEYLSLSPYR
jgi:Potential Queuosine, Q, salvage protein family